MAKTSKKYLHLEGPAGKLPVQAQDQLTRKLAMLFEGACVGLGATRAALKYGYSKQRYFQIFKAFVQGGSDALRPRKTGPQSKHVRSENIITQIIRHRFLDPEAKITVITQKMRQAGLTVSQRSVERTITEYGLQKKTLQVSPATSKTRN